MNMIENRYDFTLLFDCQDGNPNGDPEAANSPRYDPETFQGLVTDVCLKRKIRDYVLTSTAAGEIDKSGNRIFVISGSTLESHQRQPFEQWEGNSRPIAKGKETKATDIENARKWMCENFFDVRAFGAVMTTSEFNCGQVRGPVQITFARSIDRILPIEHTIARQAFASAKHVKAGTGTMGRKFTIPYGLYRAYGFVNPLLAEQTGFSNRDLTLLWKSLANLFEMDRAAARGTMATRGLYIFKHESRLGNAHAHRLFESVRIARKSEIDVPRAFSDYSVIPPNADTIPKGVTLIDGLADSFGAK